MLNVIVDLWAGYQAPPAAAVDEEPPTFVLNTMAVAIVALPILRPGLPANAAPADLFMAAAAALVGFWIARVPVTLRAPYAVAVTLTVTAGALGPLLRLSEVNSVTLGVVLVQELWLLAFAAAVYNLARTPRALARLLHAWCVAGMLWAAVLYVGLATGVSYLTGITSRTGQRVALTLGDSNYAANYFLVSMLVIIACRWPRHRGVRAVGVGALAVAVFLTGSNGGMLSATASLAVIGFVSLRNHLGAVAALGVAAALVLGLAVMGVSCNGIGGVVGPRACVVHPTRIVDAARNSDNRQLRDSVGRASQSVGQRGELVTELVGLSRTVPITGLGPQSTRKILVERQVPFAKEAHNDYLAAIVERGPLGFAALAVLFLSVLFRVLPITARRPGSVLDGILPRSDAVITALVVMALAGWFYEILHTRHLWALLALVAAAGRMAASDERSPAWA